MPSLPGGIALLRRKKSIRFRVKFRGDGAIRGCSAVRDRIHCFSARHIVRFRFQFFAILSKLSYKRRQPLAGDAVSFEAPAYLEQ